MKEELFRAIRNQKCTHNLEDIKNELMISCKCKDENKDILIVVKDQLTYIENCINSLYDNTSNFNLYLWDNASQEPTKNYLELVAEKDNVVLVRSEENLGFLRPNNELAKLTKSNYIVLLNSDTELKKDWDLAMLGWLQTHPNTLEVGYCGSKLDDDFKGGLACFGSNIDYVCGWAVCIPRKCYDKFGLFDEQNLELAYCEDADFSLRIKESGAEIYALHLDYVIHYENKTVVEVNKNPESHQVFMSAFQKNHEYLRKRWGNRLLSVES